jgi:hypothetical protein
MLICASVIIFMILSLSSCPTPGGSASVVLGPQTGYVPAGGSGNVTFAVTTTNIANGATGTVSWYTDSSGKTGASAPVGVTATVTAISNNAATVTMTLTPSAAFGVYYFTVTFGSTASAVAKLDIPELL